MTAFPCGQPAPTASNVNFKTGEARAVGAIVGLGAGNTLCVIADTTVHVIVDVTGFYASAPGFGPTASVVPTAGRRVVDSRNGIGGPLQPLAAGEVRSFDPVAGQAGAADAAAVMLNFVSTDAAGAGFLTAYPCGGTVPNVSTLNYVAGEAATNLATIELGVDRRVCIVSSVPTNVIVDVFAVMTGPTGSPLERLSFDKPAWPPFNAGGHGLRHRVRCGYHRRRRYVECHHEHRPPAVHLGHVVGRRWNPGGGRHGYDQLRAGHRPAGGFGNDP